MDKQGNSNTKVVTYGISFVASVLLVGIAVLVAWQYDRACRDEVLRGVQRQASGRAYLAEKYLAEITTAIEQLAQSHSLEELTDQNNIDGLLALLQHAHPGKIVDLGVVGPQCRLMSYAGPFHLGKSSCKEQRWYQEALSERLRVSDIFAGRRDEPHLLATLRLSKDQAVQEGDWLIRAGIDYPDFTKMVARPGQEYPGSAFVLNAEGEPQTTPWASTEQEVKYFSAFLDSKAATGGLEKVFAMDFGAGPSLYAAQLINQGRWVLVTRVPSRVAFQKVDKARCWALAVIGLGGLLFFAFMAFVVGRVMKPRGFEKQENRVITEQVIEMGKLAAVGELAAGIAHEINNPVAVMMEESGWIGDILDEPWFREHQSSEEVFRALDQIHHQGARCRDITQKLLSFARKTDPTLKRVCLNELLNQLSGLSERKARYGNVKIVMDLDPNLPDVMASPSELQQVLLNLLNNSVDAMEKNRGGDVVITTAAEQGCVVVSIADTGEGIPQSDISRIFEPFYTTKPVGKGTGLGLSICYGIVDKLGGTISVKSELNQGTTFTIRIPGVDNTAGCVPTFDHDTGG